MTSKRRVTSTRVKPLIVFVGLLLGSACGSRTDAIEGETHWLSSCSEARPCSDGLSCECGVCTSACKRDADCTDHEADSVCSPGKQTRYSDECSASELTKSVCVAENDLIEASPVADAGSIVADSGVGRDGADAGAGPEAPDVTGTAQPQPSANNGLPSVTDKIDLLFVIDNSSGMEDKQELLRMAVPRLISRLVNPLCIDTEGEATTPEGAGSACPAGATREFQPVADINVAVITTSLGDVGAADGVCTPDGTAAKSERNDGAHLLGLLPRGADVLADEPDATNGFLHWGGASEKFDQAASNLVYAAGEFGCGYEQTLESWYRFLVDPAPYTRIVRNDCGVGAPDQCIGPELDGQGFILTDSDLLAQRQAFLRPDSLVAIVMLSDENDCSFRTTGQSWRLTQLSDPAVGSDVTVQFRSSAACESDPEDACCFSCGLVVAGQVPTGCSTDGCGEDGENAEYPAWGSEPPSPDHPNLRCFEQKRRFGVDHLFPVQRYVNALKNPQICPQNADLSVGDGCVSQTNPLYDDLSTSDSEAKQPARSPSQVFLAGIVGVPWQDLAQDPSPSAELKYRKSVDPDDPAAGINWDWLLGATPMDLQPTPGDLLMHEQVEPRDATATNPAPGGNVAAVTADRGANPVNGHEWDTASDYAELQHACNFPIQPRNCPADVPGDPTQQNRSCDCTTYGNDEDKNPLCQDQDNNYGLTQYYAKATPGIRELQVLYGYKDNAIVASICPKVTEEVGSPDFGYLPAVAAIVDRLKERLSPAL